MDIEIITLFLPVCWAVVSTIIALVLYKSSEAFFESNNKTKGKQRKIRIVGSVTIAAVAFFGMQYATPKERLKQLPKGSIILQQYDIRKLHELSVNIDRNSLELLGCSTTATTITPCKININKIREAAVSLNSTIKNIIENSIDKKE